MVSSTTPASVAFVRIRWVIFGHRLLTKIKFFFSHLHVRTKAICTRQIKPPAMCTVAIKCWCNTSICPRAHINNTIWVGVWPNSLFVEPDSIFFFSLMHNVSWQMKIAFMMRSMKGKFNFSSQENWRQPKHRKTISLRSCQLLALALWSN